MSSSHGSRGSLEDTVRVNVLSEVHSDGAKASQPAMPVLPKMPANSAKKPKAILVKEVHAHLYNTS